MLLPARLQSFQVGSEYSYVSIIVASTIGARSCSKRYVGMFKTITIEFVYNRHERSENGNSFSADVSLLNEVSFELF